MNKLSCYELEDLKDDELTVMQSKYSMSFVAQRGLVRPALVTQVSFAETTFFRNAL